MKTQLVNLKAGGKLLFNKQTEVNGISVVFSFNAGAINDPKGKLGVAHFCEHLIYSFPNAKMSRQEKFDTARKFQYSNALTGPTTMKFIIRTIDEKLEEAFDYITESFASIKLTQEEFEIEQKIIRDEINTRKMLNKNLLYSGWYMDILKNERTKNFIASPAGTIETFNKITMKDLKEFIDSYLTLNNLTLVVVGNTKLSKVKKLVKEYVETRFKISNKQCYELINPEIHKPKYNFRKSLEEGKAILNIVYPLKPMPAQEDFYKEKYIANILSSIIYEMTFNYYRVNKNLCYSCTASVDIDNDWLIHEFNMPCGEENLQSIIDLYEDYMTSLPNELPINLFDKVKDRKLGAYDFDFVQLGDISTSCCEFYQNKRKLYGTKLKQKIRKLVESVTYEEANEMYKSLFKVNPIITVISNDEKYKDYKYKDFKVIKK